MGWLGRAEKTTDHHCPLCQGPDLGLAADKLGALVDKRTQGRKMGVWPRQGGARGLAQVHTLLSGITSRLLLTMSRLIAHFLWAVATRSCEYSSPRSRRFLAIGMQIYLCACISTCRYLCIHTCI